MARTDQTERRRGGRFVRRTMTTLLVAGLALAGLVAVPAGVVPAAAAGGITEESHARYVVSKKGKVTATVTTTITNVTPDRGNTYYYWDAYGIGVPSSAKNLRASSGGVDLRISTVDSEDPNIRWATAGFSPLRYGRSRTIEWTYTIAGDPIRSDRWARVGPGYGTFAVFAYGDEGRTSVEVDAPSSMTFDATARFTPDTEGKRTVYSLDDHIEDVGTWAVVSLRDHERSDEREIEVGDTSLTLQAFRGDDAWLYFAADRVSQGLPVIEGLTGSDWPGDIEVIREDVSPQVLGYAWYDETGREIVLAEDLDEATLFHELGHAWFNEDTVRERWLSEGLTEVTAFRVIDSLDGKGTPRKAPKRDAQGAVALNKWSDGGNVAREDYGYAASYTVVEKLLGDLDDETFTEVVRSAVAGESAYEPAGSTEHRFGTVDWKRFLDLAAERGGVDGTKVFRQWVATGPQKKQLAERADARAEYERLDTADGDWAAPYTLRRAMTVWDYDEAGEVFEVLDPLTVEASALQEAAARTGLGVPDSIRAAYEDAGSVSDLTEVGDLLPRTTDTLEQVHAATEAVAADRDPVTELGERVLAAEASAAEAAEALASGDLERAQLAATETTERADRALWVGIALVIGALVGLALLVLVPWLVVRRRRRRPAAVLTEPRVVAVVAAPGVDGDRDGTDGQGTDAERVPAEPSVS
ncbi:hypothetical protein [Isoptericola sp. 178]|uniref:hypothetical protein n=1 Tax=Isoptericola sp. 178 TaxID=3064651 RepID=UPI0027135DE8|nr:hypothetical protein [Isoptericola sp. 178]MDO8145680.1 hypothetical protein [Isoptericola sp. 178]